MAAPSVSPSPQHLPIREGTSTYKHALLLQRLGADTVSAFAASSLVAPVVTLLDKSIVLRTHSAEPLGAIIRSSLSHAFRHPLLFLVSTPYLLIHGLYASTYLAANLTDTWASSRQALPAAHIGSGSDKFLVTAAVNMSLCMYKDARFARFFGATSAASARSVAHAARAAVPRASLALFASRDALTIFASFNAPTLLAPWLGGSVGAAQFMAPAAVQLLSTPLHLLGLDLFNRRSAPLALSANCPRSLRHETTGVGWRERWRMVQRDWLGASIARMGRIVPAYGVGGTVNRELRTFMMRGSDS